MLAGGGVLAGLGAQADQMRLIEARIKSSTAATNDWRETQNLLIRSSMATGSAMEETVKTFQSMARVRTDLGATDDQLIAMTQTVQQLGVIGGSSTDAMKFGLRQFNQAMSTSIVRAEEFNSIVENIPEVAKRIADGMGIGVGQLQLMARTGKLLSADVFNVLLKQAYAIDKEFANFPVTIERGRQALETAFMVTIGNIDAVLGASKGIGELLVGSSGKLLDSSEVIITAFSFTQQAFVVAIAMIDEKVTAVRLAFLELQQAALHVRDAMQTASEFLNKEVTIDASLTPQTESSLVLLGKTVDLLNSKVDIDVGLSPDAEAAAAAAEQRAHSTAEIKRIEEEIATILKDQLASKGGMEMALAAEGKRLDERLAQIKAARELDLENIGQAGGTDDAAEDAKLAARREKLLTEARNFQAKLSGDKLRAFGLDAQAEQVRYDNQVIARIEQFEKLKATNPVGIEIEQGFANELMNMAIVHDQALTDIKIKGDEQRLANDQAAHAWVIEQMDLQHEEKIAKILGYENAYAMAKGELLEEQQDKEIAARLKGVRGHRAILTGMYKWETNSARQNAEFVLDTAIELTAGLAQSSKTMFNLNKAAAIANAIMSTAVGVAKALEWGFPLGPIFAAVIGAAGAAQVAAIASTSFGGSSTGSVAGVGSGIPSQAASIPQAPVFTATERNSLRLEISMGPRTGDKVTDVIADNMAIRVNERDSVFISPNSRQSIELRDGGLG